MCNLLVPVALLASLCLVGTVVRGRSGVVVVVSQWLPGAQACALCRMQCNIQ